MTNTLACVTVMSLDRCHLRSLDTFTLTHICIYTYTIVIVNLGYAALCKTVLCTTQNRIEVGKQKYEYSDFPDHYIRCSRLRSALSIEFDFQFVILRHITCTLYICIIRKIRYMNNLCSPAYRQQYGTVPQTRKQKRHLATKNLARSRRRMALLTNYTKKGLIL